MEMVVAGMESLDVGAERLSMKIAARLARECEFHFQSIGR